MLEPRNNLTWADRVAYAFMALAAGGAGLYAIYGIVLGLLAYFSTGSEVHGF